MRKENNLYNRYGRQMVLKGFGEEGQHRLSNAKVLVIGAGGLGCPALQYLAAAGIGTIGVADDDVVSLSDLHRQVLYATGDVGLPKVEVAALKLSRLNPEVKVQPHQIRLENSNALAIIRRYDWVIDGTDNFASRYMINDACVLLDKPLVYGAVSQYEGQVAVFNYHSTQEHRTGVNYRHIFPHPPQEGEVQNCAEAGVLGVLPGIIGAMQAAEAIKLITGIGTPLVNRLLTYTVLTNEMYEVGITPSAIARNLSPPNEEAFLAMDYRDLCGDKEGAVIEIDAERFTELSKKPSSVVIDVREKGELPLVTNFKHRQIPMSVFKETVSGIKEQTVLLFCQHGTRSLYAAEILQKVFDGTREVYSLRGGLMKWGPDLQ